MPLLGSHLSIAGGYYKAVVAAGELEMDCVQIFTKNNNQWRAKPITEAEVEAFQSAMKETGVGYPIAHNSYLINMGSANPELREKSIDSMVVELERANQLGIANVVAHPGAHGGDGEEAGIERIVDAIDTVCERTKELATCIALETTAGQGSSIGHRFEEIGAIIRKSKHPDRLTVCVDTCHIFAAGYPLASKKDYKETFAAFDREVGIDRIVAFHINDSKKDLGSRVDRHEHIGLGKLGIEPFEHLMNDRRFKKMPMYLETAKEIEPKTGKPWDEINMGVLRKLMKKKGA